ncbi:TIGR03435 family protein [Occallatibacter savannae]|uniref:TIGR03435 family protein n=1 Tax=Occallatibacter savannae TaxID=1002691 RepID=UPI0013A54555|nr:TIGR03435 family protein [Occallatibacter savannae]
MQWKRQLFGLAASPLALMLTAAAGESQVPNERAWEQAAGGKMAFEVASVRLNAEPLQSSNFRLSPDDAYAETGGLLDAVAPVGNYIEFAYKLQPTREQWEAMYAHVPQWVTTSNYEIHARAPTSNPSKDQMRLMMQSLLRERFGLVVHFESRETPVLEMNLVKPGKLGTELRPHQDGPPCTVTAPPGSGILSNSASGGVVLKGPEVFPARCGAVEARFESHEEMLMGGRDTTMDTIANYLSIGRLGRPVVDVTGLTGRFDLKLSWTPDPGTFRRGSRDSESQDAASSESPQAPPFLEAVREQLGLKLTPARAQLKTLVIDHVNRPSEN